MRRRRYHKLIHTIALLLCMQNVQAQQEAMHLYHRAQNAITEVMVHDIISPPVASRVYLYSSVAAYEAARTKGSALKPFVPVHGAFPRLRLPDSLQLALPELSAAYAAMLMAEKLVFSEQQLRDSMHLIIEANWPRQHTKAVSQSYQWARLVVDSVWAWSKTDNYAATRKLRRYTYGKADSMWKPTPPGYIDAVEPHWGKMRPIVMDNVKNYTPALPIPFGKEAGSPFYQQAKEVYEVVKNLSTQDSGIALFWDCNPFHLSTQGHLMFATKKLSPGGHWMSITGIACTQTRADINTTVKAYLIAAMALYDGFISCWHEKYRSHLIRPETYINAYMDENWKPLLQTPPFPEYTSGHSVISSAAAEALTYIFGDGFAYADDTETGYGLPVRHFNSFRHAAQEAAISRFYGGIHYRQAIEEGSRQGMRIGSAVTTHWKQYFE